MNSRRFLRKCGRGRKVSGIWKLNHIRRVGVGIVKCIVYSPFLIAPAHADYPVIDARGGLIHVAWNCEAELAILNIVGVCDGIKSPVMIAALVRQSVSQRQAWIVVRKKL